nr:hypothetical protein [Cryobacterium sp. SO1]
MTTATIPTVTIDDHHVTVPTTPPKLIVKLDDASSSSNVTDNTQRCRCSLDWVIGGELDDARMTAALPDGAEGARHPRLLARPIRDLFVEVRIVGHQDELSHSACVRPYVSDDPPHQRGYRK